MAVTHLDEYDFDEVVNSSKVPVLVDFWATWCGPCMMQAPILDDVSSKLGENAVIAKLNVDETPDIAVSMGVASIPTMVVFKDGKEVDRMIGLTEADEIIKKLENIK